MRLLHLSDTHLGALIRVHGAPAGWDRMVDHRAALEAAVAPALAGEVDLVVHCGDLFHSGGPPSEEVWWAWDLLTRLAARVPTVLLAGKHDSKGLERHLPRNLPNLHLVDKAARLEVAGLTLGAVAYTKSPRTWQERAAAVCEGGVDLLLAHQPVDGAEDPGFSFRVGAQKETIGAAHLPEGVTHVLCGYVHRRQVVEVGDVAVVFAGAAERTGFAERFEAKGTAVWERIEGRWTWHFNDLPTRRMVVVDREEDIAGVREGDLVMVYADPWESLAGRCHAAGAIVVQQMSREEREAIAADDQVALPLGAIAYLPSVRAARGED